MTEVRIQGGTVVTSRKVGKADVLLRDGRVVRVGSGIRGGQAFSARGLVVLPGVVDAHVHLELPVGGTRSADDFLTGTRAAAAGGVTTVVDFTVGAQNLSLPEAFTRRLDQAQTAVVDFSFHAEMVGWTPDRAQEIAEVARLGLGSFKFYTAYASSGRRTDLGTLRRAMELIRDAGGVAMVHAESEELVDPHGGPYPWARPEVSEEVAIAEVGILARATGCPTYIAHISSAQGLAALRQAQRQGAPVVGETCPHYLLLDENVLGRPDGHLFTVTPPLRKKKDQQALWQALAQNKLQAVGTDHCPFTRAQKDPYRDAPTKIPSGLPGVETLFVLLFSQGVARGRIGLSDLAWLLGEGPARAFGLYPQKGSLRPGADADLVLLDPKASWTLHAQDLHMATDFSPYEGLRVQGRVVAVLSRGEWVYQDGELLAQPGRGRFVPARPPALRVRQR